MFTELKKEGEDVFGCLFFHYLYWVQHKSDMALPFMKSMPKSKLHVELKLQLNLHTETRSTTTSHWCFQRSLQFKYTFTNISPHSSPLGQVSSPFARRRGWDSREMSSCFHSTQSRGDSKVRVAKPLTCGWGTLGPLGPELMIFPPHQSSPDKWQQEWMAPPARVGETGSER